MKNEIYSALQRIHQNYESQAQASLPTFGMPLGSVLKEMGLPSNQVTLEFCLLYTSDAADDLLTV